MEPFEVMISESQERMCAAVVPEPLGAVRRSASAGACRRRSSAGSPRTATSRRGRRAGPDGAPNPGARESGARPGPGAHRDAIVHERVARPRPTGVAPPRPGAPAPAERRPAGAGYGPGRGARGVARGPDRASVAPGSSTSTTRRSARTRCRLRVAPPGAAGQGHPQGARCGSTDARTPGGALDPWLAPRCRRGGVRNVRSPARVRSASRTASTVRPIPTRPEAFWQLTRRASAASLTRAGHWACRSPVATSASTTNCRPGPSHPRRSSAWSGCSTMSGRSWGRPSPRRAMRSCSSGTRSLGSPDPPTRCSPGQPPRTTRRCSTSPARRLSSGSSGKPSPAASSPPRRTCRAVGWPWRSPSPPCGAVSGASLRVPVSHSPAVDLFGEGPSRLVVSCRPRYAAALALLARQHGLPVETLGAVAGERLVMELTAAGATGAADERGSRVADTIDVRVADLRQAWDHGLARALGWEG